MRSSPELDCCVRSQKRYLQFSWFFSRRPETNRFRGLPRSQALPTAPALGVSLRRCRQRTAPAPANRPPARFLPNLSQVSTLSLQWLDYFAEVSPLPSTPFLSALGLLLLGQSSLVLLRRKSGVLLKQWLHLQWNVVELPLLLSSWNGPVKCTKHVRSCIWQARKALSRNRKPPPALSFDQMHVHPQRLVAAAAAAAAAWTSHLQHLEKSAARSSPCHSAFCHQAPAYCIPHAGDLAPQQVPAYRRSANRDYIFLSPRLFSLYVTCTARSQNDGTTATVYHSRNTVRLTSSTSSRSTSKLTVKLTLPIILLKDSVCTSSPRISHFLGGAFDPSIACLASTSHVGSV